VSRGARFWNVAGVAVGRLTGFATVAIVARAAGPGEVGLVALAAVAFGVLTVVNDVGVGGVLMTDPTLSRRDRGVALSVLLGWAAFLTALGVVSIPVAALLLGDPRVADVLLVLCAGIPFLAVFWYLDPVLVNDGRSADRFVLRAVQGVAGLGVGTWLALDGAGAFALAYAQLAGAVAVAAVGLTRMRHGVRPAWDRATARRLVRRGRGFFAQGGLAFVAQNADNAVVGRFLGATSLGVYAMTYRLGELPYSAIAEPLSHAAIPAYVDTARSTAERLSAYYRTLRTIVVLAAFPAACLVGGAGFVLPLLLGPLWHGHSAVVAVFGVWSLLRVVQAGQAWFANALGGAGFGARATAALLCVKIPALVLASVHGLVAVAVVMVGAAVLQFAAVSVFTRRLGVTPAATARAVAPGVGICAVVAVLVHVGARLGPGGPVYQVLVLLAAGACYAVLVVAQDGRRRTVLTTLAGRRASRGIGSR
jgi:O-antigen/teichoic acid export membrane protein